MYNLVFSIAIAIVSLLAFAGVLVLVHKAIMKIAGAAGFSVFQSARDILFLGLAGLWIAVALWTMTGIGVTYGPRLAEDKAIPRVELDKPLAPKVNSAPPVQKDQDRVRQTREIGDATKTD